MQKRALLLIFLVALSILIVGCSSEKSGEAFRGITYRCSDSDGGRNFNIAGTTTGTQNGVKVKKIDNCVNQKTVEEFYCAKDIVASTYKDCSEVYSSYTARCLGGRCIGK